MSDELELLEREYFSLEAHEWKKKEIGYEKQLKVYKKEILKRQISIAQFQIEKLRDDIKEQDEQLISLNVKLENVDVAKKKVIEDINERLGIDGEWGYDPETLKISF